MKSSQLFAREREWAALSSAFGKRSAGLVIVLGRRRQGKTTLVAAATKASGGLYFCAAEQSPEQNLEDFGRALSEWRNDGLPVRFGSWSEALERAGLVLHGAPLCIDEVGYLIARAPEVPSIVQRLVDGHGTSSARFILCGSSVSMLTELTTANQPLRGRATLELVVEPFAYRTAAKFWSARDPVTALWLWAVVGGTPAYRDWCSAAPARVRDVPAWVADNVLEPTRPLHREGRIVVLEAEGLADRGAHLPVLVAIARGASSRTAIAAAIGRPETALAPSIDVLCATGLVRRIPDPLHGRRGSYELAEPIVRVWHTLVEPVERRLLHVNPRRAIEDLIPALTSRIVAPAYEQVVRDWMEQHASEQTVGGPFTAVGPARLSGRTGESAQLDIVVVDRGASGQRTVRAIGQARIRNRKATMDDLHRLETVRDRLGQLDAKLVIASAEGFTRELEQQDRRRRDLELVDADRLYEGS